MILSAQTLRKLQPVTPFEEQKVSHGMTYGLGPCGYDIRIDQDITLLWGSGIDSFQLASSIEHFDVPDYLCAMVYDKSTWARRGVCVQNTIIEPGWSGYLTLELTNHSDEVVEIKKGMPIAQVVFCKLDKPTDRPYKGKYQDQEAGPQQARYDKDTSDA